MESGYNVVTFWNLNSEPMKNLGKTGILYSQ